MLKHFLLTLVLLVPTIVLGQETNKFVPLVGLPNSDGNPANFESFINTLYYLSIGIAALLAVIKIIIAGVKYMLSDIVTSKEEAKKDIKGALLGLLIVLGAVLILEVINPQLTNINVEIETVESPEYIAPAARDQVDPPMPGDTVLANISKEECAERGGDSYGSGCIIRDGNGYGGRASRAVASIDYNAWERLPGTSNVGLQSGEIIVGGRYVGHRKLPYGAWMDGYYDESGARDFCQAGGSGNSLWFYHYDTVVTKIKTCPGHGSGDLGVEITENLFAGQEIWISTRPGDRSSQVGDCYDKSSGISTKVRWRQDAYYEARPEASKRCYLEDGQIYYANFAPNSTCVANKGICYGHGTGRSS